MDVRRRGRRRRTEIEEQTAPRRQAAARGEVRDDLATLAERFARSEGREAVRRRAEQVELGSITQDNFSQLLSELFHDGGITQERILVLFFFCSDLALRVGEEPSSNLASRSAGAGSRLQAAVPR